MSRTIRQYIGKWRTELCVLALGFGLLVANPSLVRAQTCDSDENHYHSGADHCDSGGGGCTVVCL